jgi:MFS superfamily sulfate permease-like transporter
VSNRQENEAGVLFKGLQPFSRKAALRDAFAGANLAFMNIPQVLGYARIATCPSLPDYTLCCCHWLRSRCSVPRAI